MTSLSSWVSMDLHPEVEKLIGKNTPWVKVPKGIRESLGNSQKGYEKAVLAYSIRNQLRYSDNLVKSLSKNEPKYYEDIITYSREKLLLYPYHLSDRIVQGLRITPFQYYVSIMERIMEQERSYDSLPNFTAKDCLRLLGIGRNQYIDLMNQHRSSRKLFRRKPPRELLPLKPSTINIDPWYIIKHGYLTEEDVSTIKPEERTTIDLLIDNGPQLAGSLNYETVHSLYRRGLIYIDVPIESTDYIVVPPLENFVMNRVLGDHFETLLYKIFVSIDEHTSVGELALVLDIPVELIKNAVSLYVRLGFAYKKGVDTTGGVGNVDGSWRGYLQQHGGGVNRSRPTEETILSEEQIEDEDSSPAKTSMERSKSVTSIVSDTSQNSTSSKRIAFLYDSTLTAYLMMGNLSPSLKNHAVTMFEVGKMPDESLDSFLQELSTIEVDEGEGEAQRYFEHARTLKETILFLRNNEKLGKMGMDLLRVESLMGLDVGGRGRLLKRNYGLLISMAPLSNEITTTLSPPTPLPHFGPPIPQVNSIWFKFFLYSVTGSGPPTLLLSRGTLLSELPEGLQNFDKYLMTSWGHDEGVVPGGNLLFGVNEAVGFGAVGVQAYGLHGESDIVTVPFPFANDDKWAEHPAIVKLRGVVDLEHSCGYITMINLHGSRKGQQKQQSNIPMTKLENVLEEESVNEDDESEESEYDLISNNPNPKNGFTNELCEKIYQEEIENEIFISGGGDGKKKFEEEELKLEKKDKDDIDFNSWTILNCHFGIPLFDAEVNRVTCERMVGRVGEEGSLERLVKSNAELATRLREFINEWQPPNPSWTNLKEEEEDSTPLPSRCFYCCDGKIEEFVP